MHPELTKRYVAQVRQRKAEGDCSVTPELASGNAEDVILALELALRSVVRAWENPGPMGMLYEMPREISYAKSVLPEVPE